MIILEDNDLALILFNQKMDRLVQNFLKNKSGRPEPDEEYLKFANICRRVAVYDVDLAWEAYVTAMTLGYGFGVFALKGSR